MKNTPIHEQEAMGCTSEVSAMEALKRINILTFNRVEEASQDLVHRRGKLERFPAI